MFIAIPHRVQSGNFKVSEIDENGKTLKVNGFAEHETEDSCWVCCRAHNRRVGYSDKKVKKFLRQISDKNEQEDKKRKIKEAKKEKKRKDKKNRGKSKSKSGKEKRFPRN